MRLHDSDSVPPTTATHAAPHVASWRLLLALAAIVGVAAWSALAVSPTDPPAVRISEGTRMCNEADKLLAEGKAAEALKLYQEVLSFLPTSPRAKAGLGKCKERMRKESADTHPTPSIPTPTEDRPEMVPQVGHAMRICTAAVSPEGRTVATGGYDNAVILWDTATGEQRQALAGHTGPVESLAFSPDGRTLVSGSSDSAGTQKSNVILWDAATGRPLRTLTVSQGGTHSVAFSHDGRTVASGGGAGAAFLWDVGTGKQVRKLTGQKLGLSYVAAMAFSPNGRLLAAGFISGYDVPSKVLVYDTASGKDHCVIKGCQGQVTSLAFSPDRRTLALCSGELPVILWDTTTGERRRDLSGYRPAGYGGGTSRVAFSPDGKTVAAGGTDGVVLWDSTTGEQQGRFSADSNTLALAFSPDGATLVEVKDDANRVVLWDVRSRKETRTFTYSRLHSVRCLACSEDGRTLFSGHYGHHGPAVVTCWDTSTGELRNRLEGSPRSTSPAVRPDGTRYRTAEDFSDVWSLASQPGGRLLAAAGEMGEGGATALWDRVTGERHGTVRGPVMGKMVTIAFSPDGQTLAAGAGNQVVLLDPATNQARHSIVLPSSEVKEIAFSPDGQTLATACLGPHITLWDVATGQPRVRLVNPAGGEDASSIAFSPDGRSLVSASFYDAVIFWDVRTGKPRHRLKDHTHHVNAVAFSPDGKSAASGSDDLTIIIWDAAGGKRLQTLRGHTSGVTSLCFLPDGRLVSGSRDGTIRYWIPATGSLLATCYSLDGGKDYLITTPQRYYTGTPAGLSAIRWRVGDQFFPAEKLQERYYKPELVAKSLRGEAVP